MPSVESGHGPAMMGSSLPEGWGWEDQVWEVASAGGREGVCGRVSHPVKR